jgi:hypothetical protein
MLWARLDIAAAAGQDGWDAAGERRPEGSLTEGSLPEGALNYLALGADLEYGVTPWVSLYARWQPGYFYSVVSGAGEAGRMGDLRFGFRLGLLGERGLIRIGFLRLALLAGVKVPLPSGDGSAWEPDTHLWGGGFGLSCDYIPYPWFRVSFSGDLLLNPEQFSDTPAFGRRGVNHVLDTAFVLEPRFTLLNPDGMMFGLPAVYEYSPESESSGQGLGDERHALWAGFSYTLVMRSIPRPFEVTVSYLIPVYGRNQAKIQRLTLSGRVGIPLLKNRE